MTQLEISSKIQLLPEHIIDQIKAGEVIERPATLIKELIENSIDAKASEISIHIVGNGIELIEISDNGIGISFNDLPYAFLRHATSKINRFEDIYNLYSYGFRGEALASMASVSKITCVSNEKNAHKATLKIEGGMVTEHFKDDLHHAKSGTHIFVKDLFYNTPARLKFIQSKNTEKNQLNKILNAFLLTTPQILFSIRWDYGDKEFYPQVKTDLRERIQKMFFNKNNAPTIEYFNYEYDGMKVEFYIPLSDGHKTHNRAQYLFVNKRFVQDIQIHKIITNTLEKYWPDHLEGFYFCFIELPPESIDVNVHPNKTVVKFFANGAVQSLISSALKAHAIKILPEAIGSELTRGHPTIENLQYGATDFETLHQHNPLIDLKSIKMASYCIGAFYLFNIDDDIKLMHMDRAVISIFNFLLKNKEERECNIPLMVGSPINFIQTNLQLIQDLESLGIETQIIASDLLIIKSYPELLGQFNFFEILAQILSCPQKETTWTELLSQPLSFKISWNDKDATILHQIFHDKKIDSSHIMTKITEDNLAKLFI